MQLAPLSDQPDPYHFAGNRKSSKVLNLSKPCVRSNCCSATKRLGQPLIESWSHYMMLCTNLEPKWGPRFWKIWYIKWCSSTSTPPKEVSWVLGISYKYPGEPFQDQNANLTFENLMNVRETFQKTEVSLGWWIILWFTQCCFRGPVGTFILMLRKSDETHRKVSIKTCKN